MCISLRGRDKKNFREEEEDYCTVMLLIEGMIVIVVV